MTKITWKASKPSAGSRMDEYNRVRGRGEAVRLTLALAGVELEQAYVDPTEARCQVAGYSDEDVFLGMGSAATRHLGRKHSLYGSSLQHQALVDQVMDSAEDIRRKYVILTYGQALFGVSHDSAKLVYWRDVVDPHSPACSPAVSCGTHFQCLTHMLKSNGGGGGWVVGEQPSIADVLLFDVVDIHCAIYGEATFECAHPELVAHKRRFARLPRIAAYLAARSGSSSGGVEAHPRVATPPLGDKKKLPARKL